jgi:hypothetical protein
MENQESSAGLALAVAASLAAILVLGGCSSPTPRGVAHQGVQGSIHPTRSALNSNYYTGGDPDFRSRGSKGN